MSLVIQGGKKVIANSGGRVIDSIGRTVIVQSASNRYFTEKAFVGDKVTRIPKILPDWVKKKKPF